MAKDSSGGGSGSPKGCDVGRKCCYGAHLDCAGLIASMKENTPSEYWEEFGVALSIFDCAHSYDQCYYWKRGVDVTELSRGYCYDHCERLLDAPEKRGYIGRCKSFCDEMAPLNEAAMGLCCSSDGCGGGTSHDSSWEQMGLKKDKQAVGGGAGGGGQVLVGGPPLGGGSCPGCGGGPIGGPGDPGFPGGPIAVSAGMGGPFAYLAWSGIGGGTPGQAGSYSGGAATIGNAIKNAVMACVNGPCCQNCGISGLTAILGALSWLLGLYIVFVGLGSMTGGLAWIALACLLSILGFSGVGCIACVLCCLLFGTSAGWCSAVGTAAGIINSVVNCGPSLKWLKGLWAGASILIEGALLM